MRYLARYRGPPRRPANTAETRKANQKTNAEATFNAPYLRGGEIANQSPETLYGVFSNGLKPEEPCAGFVGICVAVKMNGEWATRT